ncbi:hypothetical protein HanIR_Chr06g0292251 [Helianthus annuus]|nr:hypothetical protein HanIR_Chr06g0292251 [Helianthus annuus]
MHILNRSQTFTPLSVQQIVDCYDQYENELAKRGHTTPCLSVHSLYESRKSL